MMTTNEEKIVSDLADVIAKTLIGPIMEVLPFKQGVEFMEQVVPALTIAILRNNMIKGVNVE